MSCLWLVGQLGILLEIVGAFLVVYYALAAKRTVEPLKSDLDSIEHLANTVRDEVASQFRKQVVGFALFGGGLLMQFIGNFANAS